MVGARIARPHKYANGNKYRTANDNKYRTANDNKYRTANDNKYRMANDNKYQIANDNKYRTANGNKYRTANDNKYRTANGRPYRELIIITCYCTLFVYYELKIQYHFRFPLIYIMKYNQKNKAFPPYSFNFIFLIIYYSIYFTELCRSTHRCLR